jgi:hypothetical protein
MTQGITLEELLEWNEESSTYWKGRLDAHPGLMELACDARAARRRCRLLLPTSGG